MTTPASTVGRATAADVDAMVRLSERKRGEYEARQPLFWRRAPDAAPRQRAFFAALLASPDVVALVDRRDAAVVGFVIGRLVDAPPVYAPGGLVCTVDDFAVDAPASWPTTGRGLLEALRREAGSRGAALAVVVAGVHDAPKRDLLRSVGLSPASEWWVGPI